MKQKQLVVFIVSLWLGLFLELYLAGASAAALVEVEILSPPSDSSYWEGQTVFLVGDGVMKNGEKDRLLENNELYWYANGDFIGNGRLLEWRPSKGTYLVTLLGKVSGMVGIAEMTITIAPNTNPPDFVRSGDVASYNLAENILYVPFSAGNGEYYWVNMKVTSYFPLTLTMTGYGPAEFSPTAAYATYNILTGLVDVPVFENAGFFYSMGMRITSMEEPMTFELVYFYPRQWP